LRIYFYAVNFGRVVGHFAILSEATKETITRSDATPERAGKAWFSIMPPGI
jgi:hypothetical protein